MPENHHIQPVLIKDAKLLFRNFGGAERPPYNSLGDRNFNVVIEPELAEKMIADGWRIKQLKPRDDEPDSQGDYILKVKVNYSGRKPPRVALVKDDGVEDLTEADLPMVDAMDIEKADVLVNGWWSDMAGGGFGGYLSSIFITQRFDELEEMYAHLLQNATAGLKTEDEELVGAGAE